MAIKDEQNDKPVEATMAPAYTLDDVINWLQGIEGGNLSLASDNQGLAAATAAFLLEPEDDAEEAKPGE